MRGRAVTAAIASMAAMALALAWPFPAASTSAPAPLPEDGRLIEYQRTLDESWQRILEYYPDAERPDVRFVTEMTRSNFDDTLGGCLRDAGFETSYDGTGFSLTSPPGADSELASVDEFACRAAYPWTGTLERLESVEQRAATYDYFTRVLAPCLVLHGLETPAAPSRDDFVYQSDDGGRWNPYSAGLVRGADRSAWEALERDCPSTPPWQRDTATAS